MSYGPGDYKLIRTKVMADAAATNYTDSWDRGATDECIPIVIEASIAAMPAHTDGSKYALFVLQDSADNSSFADVSPLQRLSVVGVVSTGSAATTKPFICPPHTRRYIRISQSKDSGGGDDTGVTHTYTMRPNANV